MTQPRRPRQYVKKYVNHLRTYKRQVAAAGFDKAKVEKALVGAPLEPGFAPHHCLLKVSTVSRAEVGRALVAVAICFISKGGRDGRREINLEILCGVNAD